MADTDQTTAESRKFDFEAFPPDTLFYDRRSGVERREAELRARAAEAEAVANARASQAMQILPSAAATPPRERRARKERRRRIDPTTFDKQYTDDEMEFMTAMQRFKVQSGKAFPSHAEVLSVARSLGYRQRLRPSAAAEELSPVPAIPAEAHAC